MSVSVVSLNVVGPLSRLRCVFLFTDGLFLLFVAWRTARVGGSVCGLGRAASAEFCYDGECSNSNA